MNNFYKFPAIPFDLSMYIHKQRQNNACNIIINSWYNHIARKVIAINLISRIVTSRDVIYNFNPYINITDSTVLSTLNYCNRVLSGNEDREWWTKKILQVVSRFNYQINNNNTYVYNEYPQKILAVCYKIYTKFYPNYNNIWNHTQIIPLNNIDNVINDLYFSNNI
jgi:hypothetical protein